MTDTVYETDAMKVASPPSSPCWCSPKSVFEFSLLDIVTGKHELKDSPIRRGGGTEGRLEASDSEALESESPPYDQASESECCDADRGNAGDGDDDDEARSSASSSASPVSSDEKCAGNRSEPPRRPIAGSRRSLFVPYWENKETGGSNSAAGSIAAKKTASCFKSSAALRKQRAPSSPVFVPKNKMGSDLLGGGGGGGGGRMMGKYDAPPELSLPTPATPQYYGRSPPGRRGIFFQRRSWTGPSCDDTASTASLSSGSSIASQSASSIVSMSSDSSESVSPSSPAYRKRRNSAPSPSCIRSSRFSFAPKHSESERDTSLTAKSDPKTDCSVRFNHKIDVVHFTPPTETWSQGGWENYFAV